MAFHILEWLQTKKPATDPLPETQTHMPPAAAGAVAVGSPSTVSVGSPITVAALADPAVANDLVATPPSGTDPVEKVLEGARAGIVTSHRVTGNEMPGDLPAGVLDPSHVSEVEDLPDPGTHPVMTEVPDTHPVMNAGTRAANLLENAPPPDVRRTRADKTATPGIPVEVATRSGEALRPQFSLLRSFSPTFPTPPRPWAG